jgi:transposase
MSTAAPTPYVAACVGVAGKQHMRTWAKRRLRDLTRYRRALIDRRTREANRLHKVLEDAGIKLASVATDILGVSSRAILAALIDREQRIRRSSLIWPVGS